MYIHMDTTPTKSGADEIPEVSLTEFPGNILFCVIAELISQTFLPPPATDKQQSLSSEHLLSFCFLQNMENSFATQNMNLSRI